MTENTPNSSPLRLHLGCGQNYLKGYLNIDFPLDNHSVQTKSVADRHADITALSFSASTVAEVRLHHVFEHFPRPVASALLATWNGWLQEGGRIHIEVPDLGCSAWSLINPFLSAKRKMVVERHLFGSHEANWAIHYEGYSATILKTMVRAFGFRPVRVRRTSWRGTSNLILIAVKETGFSDAASIRQRAEKYLGNFLLDRTSGEVAMLEMWLKAFDAQMKKPLG